MNKNISIIIPTRNEGSYIRPTLEYIQKNLHLPYEIIVSDGKSTDGTIEMAREFTPKVVEYTGEKRQNIAMGRNAGAALATGDIYVFNDADCFIQNPDTFFNEVFRVFDEHPEIVGITGNVGVLPQNATLADKVVYFFFNLVHIIKNNILHMGEACGEFQIIRREAFQKLGGYREELITREDADMFHRLNSIGRTYFDLKLTVYHTGRRIHKTGWPRLLWKWMFETYYFALFGKNKVKEWSEVR